MKPARPVGLQPGLLVAAAPAATRLAMDLGNVGIAFRVAGDADALHAILLEHAGLQQLDGSIEFADGVGAPPPSASTVVTPPSPARRFIRSFKVGFVPHETGGHMGHGLKASLAQRLDGDNLGFKVCRIDQGDEDVAACRKLVLQQRQLFDLLRP